MEVGSTINFGPYQWLVLAIQETQALLLTCDIVEQRAYHNRYGDVPWGKVS